MSQTQIQTQTQIKSFKFGELFDVKIYPDWSVEVVEKPLLLELKEKFDYISHEIKQIDRNIAMVFITDTDQGLYIFIIGDDALVYSVYTAGGYSCGYRINLDTLMESAIIEVTTEATEKGIEEGAGVKAYPGLIDTSLCR